jgi:MFS family permease
MNELLYEYGAKFSWYITLLFGIFLFVFGIDLVISLIENYNLFLLIIVSGIYGFGMILIFIGILGILIVRRYGRKGDLILRWSIIGILVILAMIPIIFLSLIPGLWIISVTCVIYLFIYIVSFILDQRRIKRSHNPNPEDDLRIFRFFGNIILIITGIIIAVAGIAVNGFFSEFLPSIYKLGSYGFAFMFAGGILVISVIFQYYRRHREKSEKAKIVSKKRDEFNLEWFNHQYYDLGRSIQDIANELNESVITIRKWLDDNESKKELLGNE